MPSRDDLQEFTERIEDAASRVEGRRATTRYDTSTPPARRLAERATFKVVALVVTHALAAAGGAVGASLGQDCTHAPAGSAHP